MGESGGDAVSGPVWSAVVGAEVSISVGMNETERLGGVVVIEYGERGRTRGRHAIGEAMSAYEV